MAAPPIQRRKVESERAVFVNDVHVPFHDPVAVELFLSFVKWFKPNFFGLLGDFLDCEAVASYGKPPERALMLQEELDRGRALLRRMRSAAKDARFVYLEGNHEDRVTRFLNQHPEIAGLRNMKLTNLLGLDELGIEYFPYYSQVQWHGLLLEHGDMVRQKSAYTAAGMMEKRGVSGVSGHVHRLGAYYRRDEAGVRVWVENGCLCNLVPHYGTGRPNWIQGFSLGYGLKGSRRFYIESVPIIDGRLFYRGELWEAAGR